MSIIFEDANLYDSHHTKAILFLLNSYAKDLKGYGKELPKEVLDTLIDELKKISYSIIILAKKDNNYIGMIVCFLGFSTFQAKPIINIHDFTVLSDYRNQGIGSGLIKRIEEKAREYNCCKITLEVQENNINAIKLYERKGFSKTGYNPNEGNALFYMKIL